MTQCSCKIILIKTYQVCHITHEVFTDSHSIKAYRPILTSILTYNFHFFLQFSVQNSVTCDNPWHYTCFTWLMISKVHSIFIRIKPIRFISASSSWAPQEPTDNLTTIANTTFKFVEKNWKCNKLMMPEGCSTKKQEQHHLTYCITPQ